MPAHLQSLTARMRRLVDSRWRGNGLVLLYHRIAATQFDPQRLAVSPDTFDQHLDAIRCEADPMPLDALIDGAQRGRLPKRAVAVTFDDGYADVWHTAAPMLSARHVPATVFVTSDAVMAGEFWWDTAARLHLDPRSDRGWHVAMPSTEPRRRAYLDLCSRLRTQAASAHAHTLQERRDPVAGAASDAAGRPLTPTEISQLAAINGISIGSHTRSHASLAALPADEQLEEIAEGRAAVERWIGAPATLFAYPFGGDADVSNEVVAAARQAGMTLACSTSGGSVGATTNRWRVPRINMRDWSGDEFRARWRAWMDLR